MFRVSNLYALHATTHNGQLVATMTSRDYADQALRLTHAAFRPCEGYELGPLRKSICHQHLRRLEHERGVGNHDKQ